jgi:hypothetical protein
MIGGPLPLADERRRLEAVHARHAHVEQDDGEVVLQDVAQRLAPRARRDDVAVGPRQQVLQRDQAVQLVVDDEDVGLGRAQGRRLQPSDRASEARSSSASCSMFTGFEM